MIQLYNQDCMEALKLMKDNEFDLAIVDPPYRDENAPTKDMRKNGQMETLAGRPSKEYFEELRRVSKNQIIWGANNFQLPQFKGFVVWEKLTISEGFTMSMAEIASLSEELGTTSKIFRLAPQGTQDDPRIHPTQKPVKLYEWLLKKYANTTDKILDTHLGSGSIALACHNLDFDLVGYEIDKEYFEAAKARLEQHQRQTKLF